MPFFKYTLPLASASQRSSGQRCTRLFHSPRYELRARRRHACAHGLLFTAAISIYDLRAQSEAQTHGYYHTADRLVIIGLVGGLDYKNPCWEPYREVPDAFIRSFTHDSALCSQCRCGMPRVRGAHAHRGRAVEALGVPLPRRCNDRLPYPPHTGAQPPRSTPPRSKDAQRDAAESWFVWLWVSSGRESLAGSICVWELYVGFVQVRSGSAGSTLRSGVVGLLRFLFGQPRTPPITPPPPPLRNPPIADPLKQRPSPSPPTPPPSRLTCARGPLGRAQRVPGFATRLGLAGGTLYAEVNTMLQGRVPWNLGHNGKGPTPSMTSADALATRPAAASDYKATLVLQPKYCVLCILINARFDARLRRSKLDSRTRPPFPAIGLKQPQAETRRRYACLAAPSHAPQRGSGSSQRSSGQSCVGSAGARTLSESSDAPSVRDVITPDARTARSPRWPYPRTMRVRSETETYVSTTRVGHVRRRMGVPHAGLVSIGLVAGLDYRKPWLEPYREFQRNAAHETPPHFRALLPDPGAERLACGARTLAEGGLQGLPQLHFPDAYPDTCNPSAYSTPLRSRGCPARCGLWGVSELCFVSLGVQSIPATLRGNRRDATDVSFGQCLHACVLVPDDLLRQLFITCMLVTEAAFRSAAFVSTASPAMFKPGAPSTSSNESTSESAAFVFNSFESASESSASDAPPIAAPTLPAHADLWVVRNTNSKTWPDALATRPAAACAPIACPAFELMSSVALTGTNHAEGEAGHLRVMRGIDGPALSGMDKEERANAKWEKGCRACPAGMYEYMADDGGRVVLGNAGYVSYDKLQADGEAERWEGTKLGINSQDITWTVPGGGSPSTGLNVDNHAEEQEHIGGRGAGNHIIAHSPS
ncbi:hypothetical protein DFH09DRAFT_1083249 [Mycena vulgaris]|nr:hypothetical protein DFH09DRAFT_1083249 [Mycena vulgaris]